MGLERGGSISLHLLLERVAVLHRDVPLVGQVRLDGHVAAIAVADGMDVLAYVLQRIAAPADANGSQCTVTKKGDAWAVAGTSADADPACAVTTYQ